MTTSPIIRFVLVGGNVERGDALAHVRDLADGSKEVRPLLADEPRRLAYGVALHDAAVGDVISVGALGLFAAYKFVETKFGTSDNEEKDSE